MTAPGTARSAARAAALGVAAPLALWLLAPAVRADGDVRTQAPLADGAAPSASDAPPACPAPLQAAIDAAAPGDSIRLPACTSREPLEIDRPLTIDARGTLIDGRGTLDHAVIVTADDVALEGLRVTGVANPAQDGAVRAWDVDRFAFRDGTIGDSAGACISVARGEGSSITGSTLAGCGQEGIHATQADGLVVRGNRLLGNNPKGVFDPEWEAGGAKVTRSTGVVFEDNDVAGNDGPGIWCDIDCRDLTVRGNRVSANRRAGIQFEISDGAEVTGNAVWENGWAKPTWGWGAGILVSSSRNVTVDDNVIAWNADGIVVVSQERDDAPGPTTNVRTSGNTVAAEAGFEAFALAWLQDWAGGITATAAGNGSSDDRFWISGPEGGDARFAWAESFTRLAPFAATPGGSGAAYLSDADLAARLEAAGIPVHPLGDHPLGRSGLRELLVPALGAGLALLLAVAGIVALAVRRRRPSSPIPPGPDAGPDAGPGPNPNPPTQEHP